MHVTLKLIFPHKSPGSKIDSSHKFRDIGYNWKDTASIPLRPRHHRSSSPPGPCKLCKHTRLQGTRPMVKICTSVIPHTGLQSLGMLCTDANTARSLTARSLTTLIIESQNFETSCFWLPMLNFFLFWSKFSGVYSLAPSQLQLSTTRIFLSF